MDVLFCVYCLKRTTDWITSRLLAASGLHLQLPVDEDVSNPEADPDKDESHKHEITKPPAVQSFLNGYGLQAEEQLHPRTYPISWHDFSKNQEDSFQRRLDGTSPVAQVDPGDEIWNLQTDIHNKNQHLARTTYRITWLSGLATSQQQILDAIAAQAETPSARRHPKTLSNRMLLSGGGMIAELDSVRRDDNIQKLETENLVGASYILHSRPLERYRD